jgi:hypothetical protein
VAGVLLAVCTGTLVFIVRGLIRRYPTLKKGF